ncbi:hypothetical protein BDN70DRAFT_924173 [Pholiota conissans]|uniref:Uncharacterized protein n=1 Tax=Pholiota conissans TaxID=109636 RepID=A0A9P5YST0_9AGAR|nr:hypothetical protein BDN70DRAFT_924173 [Pholiota conissans]
MPGVATFLQRLYQFIVNLFWPSPDPDAAYDEAFEAYQKYQSTKNLEDLVTSIASYDRALKLRRISTDQRELPGLLVNYAVAIWDRYKDDPDPAADDKKSYLKTVIELDEEARKLWKVDPPKGDGYPTLLNNLAKAYLELSRVDPSQATSTINHSLDLNREVYNNPGHYTAALGIGEALWARYAQNQFADEVNEENPDPDVIKFKKLGEAIAKFEESLEYANMTNNASTRVTCCYFLAKAYDTRYSLSQHISDLDNALDYNRKTRGMLDETDPKLDACLRDLCVQLLHKYDSNPRSRAPLEEAKAIAEGRFDDILPIIHNRENRQATIL